MKKPLTTRHYILIVSATLLAAFLLVVTGLLVGTWCGGNYDCSFELNSVRGYDAYDQSRSLERSPARYSTFAHVSSIERQPYLNEQYKQYKPREYTDGEPERAS